MQKLVKKITIAIIMITIALFRIMADGFIIMPEPVHIQESPFPLAVTYHRVSVSINDLIATVTIDQEFYNPKNYAVEGYYFFPIPKNAVINKFSMYINGKEVESELLDAKKASQIYQSIVDRLKDPAILEYSQQGLFKARIYPIEAHSTKRIKISYTQILVKDMNVVEFIYPLNTEKFSSQKLKEVAITVDIKSSENIKNIVSTTHEIDTLYHSTNYVTLSYEEENVLPNTDFKLYYSMNNKELGVSLLTYKQDNENGFFFMNIDPGFQKKDSNIKPKELIFILDTSGSMRGEKLKKAKAALTFCIKNLNQQDTFNIVRFSTEAEALFDKPQKNTKQNIQQAINFIKNFQPIGGTNIDDAFTTAFTNDKDSQLTKMAVFITDGKPTIGQTNIYELLKKIKRLNSKNYRIFTFGIGYEINTLFLDSLAEEFGGFRTYIQPNEDIKQKIANFFVKVNSPVMTDITISTDKRINLLQIYPRKIHDIFYGSTLTLIGRYKGFGETTLKVKGILGNESLAYTYKLNFTKDNIEQDSLPALWATRRIGYLLDQIRLNGENKELIDEVTILARKYGIITPYTSYLIVEDELEGNVEEEYKTLSSITKQDKKYQSRNKQKYGGMQEQSGEESINASEEIQDMQKTRSYSNIQQYNEKEFYTDEKGQIQQVTTRIKFIQGRAFYYNENFWIDSLLQTSKKSLQTVKVKFGSKKYFELINSDLQIAKILSLGSKVRFVYKGKVFEIYE